MARKTCSEQWCRLSWFPVCEAHVRIRLRVSTSGVRRESNHRRMLYNNSACNDFNLDSYYFPLQTKHLALHIDVPTELQPFHFHSACPDNGCQLTSWSYLQMCLWHYKVSWSGSHSRSLNPESRYSKDGQLCGPYKFFVGNQEPFSCYIIPWLPTTV